MATIDNMIECATNVKNTGTGSCVLRIGFIRGAILVPKGWKLTAANLASQATLRAALEAALIADKSLRIFPVPGFKTITDNTEDPVFQTMGDGSQIYVRDGNYNWVMQYYDGGMCLSNALRSFNNAAYEALFYDDQRILFGTTIVEEDGSISLGGIPMDNLQGLPWRANDGTNVAQYRIAFSFQPAYVNESIRYVQLNFQPSQLMGLQNLLLKPNSSLAGVINFSALAGCAAENIYDLYSDEIADAALYVATGPTGLAIAITSVTAVPASKSFNLVLDDTDPNYPATAADLITITPTSASAWDTAGIKGFEAFPFTYARG